MSTLEINIKMESRKAQYSKFYLTQEERRALIQECGDSSVLLLEYYIRLAAVGDKEIIDSNTAKYFGWTVDKVRRVRRQLVAGGWFAHKRYRIDENTKGVTYYIGSHARGLQKIEPDEPETTKALAPLFSVTDKP
jgi:hypothetical protein